MDNINKILKPKNTEEILETPEIKDVDLNDLIKYIRKNDINKDLFAKYMNIELNLRYKNRPIEEKHMSFKEWKKVLLLRDKNKEELEKNKRFYKISNINISQTIKNKTYYKDKNIEISEEVKELPTEILLALRYNWFSELDKDMIYAELANRPHVMNKKEGKEYRRKMAQGKINKSK